MNPDADDRDEVLRGYGEVMLLVQWWEHALANLWWKSKRKHKNRPTGDFDTPRSQKEIARLEAAFLRETAGSVIPAIEGHLDEQVTADLQPLWGERNRLAHRFLRERGVADGEFGVGTHDELVALGNRFSASTDSIVQVLMSGDHYAGPVLEHWPGLAERILERLERGERIPRDPRQQ